MAAIDAPNHHRLVTTLSLKQALLSHDHRAAGAGTNHSSDCCPFHCNTRCHSAAVILCCGDLQKRRHYHQQRAATQQRVAEGHAQKKDRQRSSFTEGFFTKSKSLKLEAAIVLWWQVLLPFSGPFRSPNKVE
jgi:hypothetical protein